MFSRFSECSISGPGWGRGVSVWSAGSPPASWRWSWELPPWPFQDRGQGSHPQQEKEGVKEELGSLVHAYSKFNAHLRMCVYAGGGGAHTLVSSLDLTERAHTHSLLHVLSSIELQVQNNCLLICPLNKHVKINKHISHAAYSAKKNKVNLWKFVIKHLSYRHGEQT